MIPCVRIRTELGLVPGLGPWELQVAPVMHTDLPCDLMRGVPLARPEPAIDVDFSDRWQERDYLDQVNPVLVDTSLGPTAVEIVRTGWYTRREARLVRIAVTLTATSQTDPVVVITPDKDADPFVPILHPNGSPLALRWHLVWDTDRLCYGEQGRITCPPGDIPRGIGNFNFENSWSDFRYLWQSTYSTDLKSDALPEGFARLFCAVSPTTAGRSWSLRVGGLVTIEHRLRRPA